MGENRRAHSQRKTTSKWPGNIEVTRESLIGFIEALAISVVIAILFYKSAWGFISSIVIIPFWMKQYKASKEEKLLTQKKNEFKEYLVLVAGGLQTGYSIERAFKQAEDELRRLFGRNAKILLAVHEMNQRIAMNVQLEKAFERFAQETGLEEAEEIAEIISFSKRAGGDYGKHIRNCAVKTEEKLILAQEIETMMAEKTLELKVMCVIPLCIIAYISITSADFIAPLYGNITGAIVMTICLLIYGAMILLGKRVMSIEI